MSILKEPHNAKLDKCKCARLTFTEEMLFSQQHIKIYNCIFLLLPRHTVSARVMLRWGQPAYCDERFITVRHLNQHFSAFKKQIRVITANIDFREKRLASLFYWASGTMVTTFHNRRENEHCVEATADRGVGGRALGALMTLTWTVR